LGGLTHLLELILHILFIAVQSCLQGLTPILSSGTFFTITFFSFLGLTHLPLVKLHILSSFTQSFLHGFLPKLELFLDFFVLDNVNLLGGRAIKGDLTRPFDNLNEELSLSREELALRAALALSREELALRAALALSREELALRAALALSREELALRAALALSREELLLTTGFTDELFLNILLKTANLLLTIGFKHSPFSFFFLIYFSSDT
jgi:hypothetical protein